ncbi:unnamed protein product [Fusarium graminearum]|uniref:Chromosome 4, complete genome n=1 Tax=Gibberella zeae (strain ATCC MYA-4620 / CBS 123657 / FGSC 9075 / NRRL 31084 / PH-1) TaxID=229533 RepID=A0A098DSR5_GIBZE|nr:unnamed protein product [Fusarium graminearum]
MSIANTGDAIFVSAPHRIRPSNKCMNPLFCPSTNNILDFFSLSVAELKTSK